MPMRVKLRLYIRDLDLLALKHNPGFNLGSAIRQALWEYVEYGECSRIRVPHAPPNAVVLKNDQIDISFNKDKYQKVVEWILSIRPRMRNSAIKAVVRSAIANPDIGPFLTGSAIIIPEKTEKAMAAAMPPTESGSENTSTTVSKPQTASNPSKNETPNANSGDGTIDCWEFDFDNF